MREGSGRISCLTEELGRANRQSRSSHLPDFQFPREMDLPADFVGEPENGHENQVAFTSDDTTSSDGMGLGNLEETTRHAVARLPKNVG